MPSTSPVSWRMFALKTPCRDKFSWMRLPEVVDPLGCSDDEDVAVCHAPAEAGLLQRLVDRAWVAVEDGAEAVPRELANAEHRIGCGDAMGHGRSSFGSRYRDWVVVTAAAASAGCLPLTRKVQSAVRAAFLRFATK